MRGKRGQQKGAGGAAAFIAIMGLFIVLYVLFLPGDIRDDLLNDENISDGWDDDDNNSSTNDADYKLILKESPGRLDSLNIVECTGKECSHELSSFMLFQTTDSSIIEEFNAFIVKNNIMTKKTNTVTFELENMENTENLMLSFSTPKHDGVLSIKLNGNVLFEKDIDSFNPAPIELPKGYLARTNNLEFSVSPVSWEFWHTNEYQIDSLKIIGDITDLSRQKNSNSFYLSKSEYLNLERARLRFNPNCNQGSAGMLEIILNGRQMYAGVPDCEMLNILEITPTFLEDGENLIVFKSDGGNYLIDLVEIRTDLKEIRYPVYYFDVDEEDLDFVKDGDANLTVTLEFVDENVVGIYDPDLEEYEGREEYKVIMTINGHKRHINTYDELYDRVIPYEDLREEDNWIKLEPRGDVVDVAQMLVEIIPNED